MQISQCAKYLLLFRPEGQIWVKQKGKRNKIGQATAADHLEQKLEPFQIPLSYPGLESTRSYDQVSYDIIPDFFSYFSFDASLIVKNGLLKTKYKTTTGEQGSYFLTSLWRVS